MSEDPEATLPSDVPFDESDPVRLREALKLLEAFKRIRDGEKRQLIVELTSIMADEQPKTDGGS